MENPKRLKTSEICTIVKKAYDAFDDNEYPVRSDRVVSAIDSFNTVYELIQLVMQGEEIPHQIVEYWIEVNRDTKGFVQYNLSALQVYLGESLTQENFLLRFNQWKHHLFPWKTGLKEWSRDVMKLFKKDIPKSDITYLVSELGLDTGCCCQCGCYVMEIPFKKEFVVTPEDQQIFEDVNTFIERRLLEYDFIFCMNDKKDAYVARNYAKFYAWVKERQEEFFSSPAKFEAEWPARSTNRVSFKRTKRVHQLF